MLLPGYLGRVLRNDDYDSSDDSYVELLLDRINDGVLAEDRRTLQSIVSESRAAQLAFGTRGLQVPLRVLKEERDDVEPALMNSDFAFWRSWQHFSSPK